MAFGSCGSAPRKSSSLSCFLRQKAPHCPAISSTASAEAAPSGFASSVMARCLPFCGGTTLTLCEFMDQLFCNQSSSINGTDRIRQRRGLPRTCSPLREEAWRSRLGVALRFKEEAQPVRDGEPQSGSLGSVRGSVFGRIIPAAVLTAQRRRVDSRIRQDDAGTVAPGQSGDVAARVA